MSNRNQTGAGHSRADSVVTPRQAKRPRVSLSWLIPDLALLPHRTWSSLPGQQDVPTARAAVLAPDLKPHPSFRQTESPKLTEYRAVYPRDLFHYPWAEGRCGFPGDAPPGLSL